ncbi:MAG: hypothetical protein ACRCY8_02325 [Dermatophilaceae bacterium]
MDISARGQFVAVESRLMDTRSRTDGRRSPVGAGSSVTLKVAGKSGVPATGAGAVVLNVTATGATTTSFVTVHPGGTRRPNASSLNTTPGATVSNLVTVPLSAAGTVSLYNHAGSVHLVADLVGYYAEDVTMAEVGSDFFPAAPERIFDSRTDWGGRKLGPREYFRLPIRVGDADPRITAVAVTVTSTDGTASGYLSAVPDKPTTAPTTSSLNYARGSTVANLVAVRSPQKASAGRSYPTFWIANSSGASTHVVIDVVGYYATMGRYTEPGLRFRSLAPTRVLDTRSDLGVPSVGANTDTHVPAPPSMLGRETRALVGNLTGVTPSASTYLTMWGGGIRPPVSSLNVTKGVTRSNAVWTGISTGYRRGYTLYNHVGATDTLYDVTGTFEQWPPSRDTLAGVPLPSTAGHTDADVADRGAGQARAPDLGEMRRVEHPTVRRY